MEMVSLSIKSPVVRCPGQLEQAETCLWSESTAQVSFIPILGSILYSFLFVSWTIRSSISLLLKFAENALPAHPHKVVCLLILTLYLKCRLLRENPPGGGGSLHLPTALPAASTSTFFPLNKPWVFFRAFSSPRVISHVPSCMLSFPLATMSTPSSTGFAFITAVWDSARHKE